MKRFFIGLIRLWQRGIAPLLGPRCRFVPSCSEYAALAIGKYGPWRGAWKGIRRIVRCHPWGGSGVDFP